MPKRLNIPDGFSDLLPGEASRLYSAKTGIMSEFLSAGYSVLYPPSVEFVETYSASGENRDLAFNLIDFYSGRHACFRYDFTPQIGRFFATHADELPLPAKFCYEGTVLRNPEGLKGAPREICQIGVESIGESGADADAGMVSLLARSLRTVFSGEITIFVSTVAIAKSVLALVNDAALRDSLAGALSSRSLSDITEFASAAGLEKSVVDFLSRLPLSCGGAGILDEVRAFAPKLAVPAIDAMIGIASRVVLPDGVSLRFDLGDVRGFEYYTGVTFDAFLTVEEDRKVEVATGGRYDSLIGTFHGSDLPAAGFAIELLTIARLGG